MPEPTIKPGSETSEWTLTKRISQVAAVVTLLGAVVAVLPDSLYSGNHYLAAGVAALGALTKVLTALGYIRGRTDLKSAAINAAVELAPEAAPTVKAVVEAIPDSMVPKAKPADPPVPA